MLTNPALRRKFRVGMAVGYFLFSAFVVVVGISYLPFVTQAEELPKGLQWSTNLWPIWVWGVVWVLVGILGLGAAVTELRRRPFHLAIRSQITMHIAWGAFYIKGWIDGEPRSYLSARTYLAFAVLLILFAATVTKLRPESTKGERP